MKDVAHDFGETRMVRYQIADSPIEQSWAWSSEQWAELDKLVGSGKQSNVLRSGDFPIFIIGQKRSVPTSVFSRFRDQHFGVLVEGGAAMGLRQIEDALRYAAEIVFEDGSQTREWDTLEECVQLRALEVIGESKPLSVSVRLPTLKAFRTGGANLLEKFVTPALESLEVHPEFACRARAEHPAAVESLVIAAPKGAGDWSVAGFAALQNVKYLDLFGNGTCVDAAPLAVASKLSSLRVDNFERFTGAAAFREMKSLRELEMERVAELDDVDALLDIPRRANVAISKAGPWAQALRETADERDWYLSLRRHGR